ncbi:MFS transporter [Phenylobacterium sp.]|uniref:MFS transporter n=1 Tax=Phenylobacterium sp. TaxID=1871053 RepID=UPI0011F97007|nr:MFS transporter [Phenylobacterium sp.]THD63862.1 MAG: MFS transporter [Phenylobacterium sp.]
MTLLTQEYQFLPDERPSFPGSPFVPRHPLGRRIAYALVGVLIGVLSTFPNALISANVANLPGAMDSYVAQLSWLPAIYVAMNASANLTLVKARAQFGIPAVTLCLLLLYALAGAVQLVSPTFAAAVVARAVNGMMAAALVSLGIYYLLQAVTPKTRPIALVIGLGLTQLGTPLARMIPVDLLVASHGRGLHLLELAVAFVLVAATLAVPLPPSERSKAFSRLDLVTIGLLVPAFLLLSGVLGLGRLLWWNETPALGWMLAAAIPLFAAAILIETHRSNPLIHFSWFSNVDILRFAGVALLVRLALAEQSYGSVGLLSAGGLTNDQLRLLFAGVALSMVAGLVTAVLTLSVKRLPYQVIAAALIVAVGAGLDAQSTVLTRPHDLILSQCLLGFGTTLFMGPANVFGFLRMSQRGAAFFVTFAVLFSTTQNVGGLAGSALLGTYQVIEARAHAVTLSDHMLPTDPTVAARLGGAAALSGTVADPLLRTQEGGKLLGQALAQQSAVLAFNDVFRLVAALGLMTALYVLYLVALTAFRARFFPAPEAAT